MSVRSPRFVHISPQVVARGGIGSLLERHRRWPGHHFIALFEREACNDDNFHNMNFTWRDSLKTMRRRFAEVMRGHEGSIVIYHGGWGLSLFHDLDRASRRVAFLHGNLSYHQPDFASFARLVDGLISVTPTLAEAWTELYPWFPADRTLTVMGPVEMDASLLAQPISPVRKPLRLGYAGRLEAIHKRIERLPRFIAELEKRGIPFEFEVAGDGSRREWLRRQLGDKVKLLGWMPKEQLWRAMASWDAVVFFSDAEGGPIAMYEAMAVGALPIYPTIGGSWGDVYAPKVDACCHYRAGDMAAAAESVGKLFALPEAEIRERREKARKIAREHSPEKYDAAVETFLGRIAATPRISEGRRRRARLTDWLPLGVATRFARHALRRS